MLSMEDTVRVLPVVSAALFFPQLGLAQAPSSEEDATTATTTTTTTLTSTTTLKHTVKAAGAAAEASVTKLGLAYAMTSEGQQYILQGCYTQDGTEDMRMMLGQNYIAPGADQMSLSLCLKTCVSAAMVAAGSIKTYPFVGMSSGDSCYCGTAFNTETPEASLDDCTLPCVGDENEACGGMGHISIYKLSLADSSAQLTALGSSDGSLPIQTTSPSSDGSLAVSDPAVQTNSASNHSSGAVFAGLGDVDTSGSKNPGVIAGIAIGSVSGVIGMLLLVIMAAKRWTNRRTQSQPVVAASDSASSSVTAWTAPSNNIHDAASIRDAMKIDLQQLDSVVMDQHSPAPRFARKKQIGVAATTGTDYQSNKSGSPLTPRTPRTPRLADALEETHASMPPIVVHPPEIASVRGLGETRGESVAPTEILGASTLCWSGR